jgi:dipeptidyl aminopeptidase/acylaminoacyl peptidase
MSSKVGLMFIGTVLTFILSCGGGGGGDNNPSGTTENGGSSDILNPEIEGKFFIDRSDHGNPYIMDARTGSYTQIPNSHWSTHDERFAPIALKYDYSSRPIRNNNTMFMILAEHGNDSYVAMQDINGNFFDQTIHLREEILTASVSPDLRYIALTRHFSGHSKWFEIFTWDGTLVSDREMDERVFHWLDDNRILYTENRTLYFTEGVSTEVDYRLILPDTDIQEGHIDTLDVSPDGSQIAFTIAEASNNYGTTLTNSRLYIMNMDGSNIRLVATTYNDENPRLTFPKWSPDGRWLYVEEGYNTEDIGPDGIPNIGTDNNNDMYLVPTENLGKVFILNTDDSKRSPEVRRLWRSNTMKDEPGGVTGKSRVRTTFYWLKS